MEMIRHKIYGTGEVIRKEVVGPYTRLVVAYPDGRQSQLIIPESFETGSIVALGTLKDEVAQAIAQKKARFSASTPAPKTAAPVTTVTRKVSSPIPSGPIPAAFEKYLIDRHYTIETPSGNRSTVYAYLSAVDSIRTDEGMSWDTLTKQVFSLIPVYDVGGAKERIGAKSNSTYINALKRYGEFSAKSQQTHQTGGNCYDTGNAQ